LQRGHQKVSMWELCEKTIDIFSRLAERQKSWYFFWTVEYVNIAKCQDNPTATGHIQLPLLHQNIAVNPLFRLAPSSAAIAHT
jgi:hypothetical protein